MGMSSYSIQTLTEKLDRLSLSQDSIETLSLWMIHHKSKAKTSVDTWLEEFKKGDVTCTAAARMNMFLNILSLCRRYGKTAHFALPDQRCPSEWPKERCRRVSHSVPRRPSCSHSPRQVRGRGCVCFICLRLCPLYHRPG